MIYRSFGSTGWQVSAIGLGTWNIGNQWGEVDDATAYATIRTSLDHGVNLFDTAESYGIPNGLSEQRLGKALGGQRHNAYIVSKIGNFGKRTGQGVPLTTPDMIRLCAHASLHRLRTDWVDVMLCHVGDIQDPSVFLEGFDILKRDGEIREYGISTNNLDVLKRFNANGTCRVVEVDYSLVNRQPEEEFLPYCEQHGIAVLVRGPLAMGLLSGKYSEDSLFTDSVRSGWNPDGAGRKQFEERVRKVNHIKRVLAEGENMATTALRFVISHATAAVAIPGAKSPEQAAANAKAGDRLLTKDQIELFDL
ncbi:aldo/keto reductase [Paenibacillus allorhizosphaerae]|uniref:Aldo-keto reductase IolS n=1 Tax=Paenibacillus allorhizosphaerae TaxID=2849866 RepID=A0ABM8VEL5_9BACL|nr:aldo/keto reductase [Paenibacillus allorhizosphaerae]CAG7631750.1 Aldo-keto reductase IolS [Paenibacillus allorhizosphaerae]